MRLMPVIALALICTVIAPVSAVNAQRADQREVRVSVNVSIFVNAPGNDGDAAIRAQENGRKALYERAGRECELLMATLASECRLDSVNVNSNRAGGHQSEGFNVSGNFGLRVVLK